MELFSHGTETHRKEHSDKPKTGHSKEQAWVAKATDGFWGSHTSAAQNGKWLKSRFMRKRRVRPFQ